MPTMCVILRMRPAALLMIAAVLLALALGSREFGEPAVSHSPDQPAEGISIAANEPVPHETAATTSQLLSKARLDEATEARLREQRTEQAKLNERFLQPDIDDPAPEAFVTVSAVLGERNMETAVRLLELPTTKVPALEKQCQDLLSTFGQPHKKNMARLNTAHGSVIKKKVEEIGAGMTKLVIRRDPTRGRAKLMYINNVQLWVYASEAPEIFAIYDDEVALLAAMREAVATLLK